MSGNFDLTPYENSRDDFWSDTPMQAAPGSNLATSRPPTRKPDNPADRVRRLFRGRMALAVVLALVGAVIGAAVGWWSQTPEYLAQGYVEIKPVMPRLEKGSSALSQYRDFMNTQEIWIKGTAMADRAMKLPDWTDNVDEDFSSRVFARSTQAKHSQEDYLLQVGFQHPDEEIAIAGANAVIQAFKEDFLERRDEVASVTGRSLTDMRVTQDKRLGKVTAEIAAISIRYGGIDDLTQELDKVMKERDRLSERQELISTALTLAKQTREARKSDPLSVQELALYDQVLAGLLMQREVLTNARFNAELGNQGPESASIRAIEARLKDNEDAITARSDYTRQRYFGEMTNIEATVDDPGMIEVTASRIDSLEARLEGVDRQLTWQNDYVREVSQDQRALALLTDERTTVREEIATLDRQIRDETANANYQGELGQITLSLPESASLAQDRRMQMAVGGGIFGFSIPIGIILLLGLTDSRFRYSDDAAQASEKVTLLGILPNLPDRLSDPNQASIAAHCVHQIRTILQINHGSDESRAFAVTSGQRGDGKTSLALALGLSYAASGCRTLLIDTDLQRGGLSARLGVHSDEGIMDALAGADLLEYVCETDVADLAILPIGKAGPNHAGAFSPGAMRMLLDQARRHFDVVVCDTGPILGSIEATPVASAVDGVLLTVSRGQSRPLVSKALTHLEGVGATVSGLVFNRAQASDFERSVSGMNLRGGVARMANRSAGHTNGTVLSQN